MLSGRSLVYPKTLLPRSGTLTEVPAPKLAAQDVVFSGVALDINRDARLYR
ncbi:MAG: hypothetical protein ACFB14_26050 [Leptolyngbyaceae cyanobacterium]